jgi:mono/diheme cytochrome c family protein
MPKLRTGLLLISVSLLAIGGCGKKAEREWSPTDHDRVDETPSGPQQAQQQAPRTAAPLASVAAAGPADVWRSTCAPCHGATGKGDGPAGRALRAPDLTALQGRATDEQLANVIKNGRGQMPAYGSFPPELVGGLVKHIRSLK